MKRGLIAILGHEFFGLFVRVGARQGKEGIIIPTPLHREGVFRARAR